MDFGYAEAPDGQLLGWTPGRVPFEGREDLAWRVDRFGYRIGEIPIVFEQRMAGASKIDSSEIYRAAWHVLSTAFRRSPARR